MSSSTSDYTLTVIESTDSTNSYVAAHADEMASGDFVMATDQRAGRGQRGNSWEAEPGKNITISALICPTDLHPREQFVVSQVVSVAIVELLRRHLPESTEISVKWPNDIYVGDRKICGILIENTVTADTIVRSIVGIGLNVNQTAFVSDAPNPVSMAQIVGHDFDLEPLVDELCRLIMRRLADYEHADSHPLLRDLYSSNLWRREGYHRYAIPGSDEVFEARIDSVAPDGRITLVTREGLSRQFWFKEVAVVLPSTGQLLV